ncbi:MAG: galactosyldiacylglycerol synthase [Bryobacteraceae bacterium]|nr:galactosyldiacylglycerol synthase [Bryobacteraceae bacterium]
MRRLDFIFFDAGGGHRSAATALKLVIERQGWPWQVRLVNLQEVLDPLDIFGKYTGLRVQDLYNHILKKGWTLGATKLARILQALIRFRHDAEVQLLKEFWQKEPPDLVVSLIPNFNRAIHEGAHAASPRTPVVTILTDLADFPPHFWIERESQYLICGTDRAVEQAYSFGHSPERVFRTSGMILHPRYYERIDGDRGEGRRALGLDPNLPTGVVLFGGQGSWAMSRILDRLDRSGLNLQLILICGHNEALARALSGRTTRLRKFVVGFTTDVPYYMHLSDFFIGKPGPGSISEALAMNLPVILERNAFTLPQERYNADWVREREVGLVVPSFRQIDRAVARLLEPGTFERLRRNAAAIENQAVFEIPAILRRVMESSV